MAKTIDGRRRAVRLAAVFMFIQAQTVHIFTTEKARHTDPTIGLTPSYMVDKKHLHQFFQGGSIYVPT